MASRQGGPTRARQCGRPLPRAAGTQGQDAQGGRFPAAQQPGALPSRRTAGRAAGLRAPGGSPGAAEAGLEVTGRAGGLAAAA
ncbi:unnamed protein product, partial [Prorocentrum cordatum]